MQLRPQLCETARVEWQQGQHVHRNCVFNVKQQPEIADAVAWLIMNQQGRLVSPWSNSDRIDLTRDWLGT